MSRLALAFRLARRELRGGLGSFRVFLACLALGVAAIAAVGSVSEAMRAGIARDARLLLGGDASIRLLHRPMPAEARAALGEAGRVSEVVAMRAMARPEAGGARRTLVELKAVDGAYPLFGAVELVGGGALADALAERGGVFGAAIDPALSRRLGLATGDLLRIGRAAFEVRAEIAREPDRATRFANLGPRAMIALDALPATGLVQPGSLVDYLYRVGFRPGLDGAAWLQAFDARFPDAGWRVRDLRNASPGLKTFIGRATQFLTLVGLTALLVGGVGIANAVGGLLERRAGAIAILKCLGAPGGLVFEVYLIQTLALATAGIAIGVAAGALAPPLASELMAGLFPATLPFDIHWRPLAMAAAFGYLATLAFSVWPLGKARETRAAHLFRALVAPPAGRPRAGYVALALGAAVALAGLALLASEDPVLTGWFILGALGVLALFGGGTALLLRTVRRLPSPRRPGLRLAVANLHRPGSPTPGVVLSLGIGLTVLVAVALVQHNLGRQIGERIPDAAPSFFFIDIQPGQSDAFAELAAAVPGVERIERTPMVRGRIARVAGVPADEIEPPEDIAWALESERGLTYAARPPEGANVVAGAWWPEDYDGPPLLSFDEEIAAGLGVGIGDSIAVNILGREIEAEIASLRRIDWSTLAMNFVVVFSPGVLEAAPHAVISTVYADGIEAEEAVLLAATDAFPNVSAIRVKDALDNAARILEAVGVAVRATASVTLLAGVLVLAGAAAAGRRRRVYDAVVLKTLGATRRRVMGAYLAEYAMLGLLTAAVAAAAGTVAARFVVLELMRADGFAADPAAILAVVALGLACAIAFGLAGAWRALGQKAAPLLRNE